MEIWQATLLMRLGPYAARRLIAVTLARSGRLLLMGFTRGFRRRHPETPAGVQLPPGQYLTDGFPVLSAGPTPHIPLDEWEFTVTGSVGESKRWSWEEFQALPSETVTVDIHCVTSWSKLGTEWEGVSVDTLFENAEVLGAYSMVHSY